MKIKFTCISKKPPSAYPPSENWHVVLEPVDQEGIKLKDLVEVQASPEAATIFELGAEYELSFVRVK